MVAQLATARRPLLLMPPLTPPPPPLARSLPPLPALPQKEAPNCDVKAENGKRISAHYIVRAGGCLRAL